MYHFSSKVAQDQAVREDIPQGTGARQGRVRVRTL